MEELFDKEIELIEQALDQFERRTIEIAGKYDCSDQAFDKYTEAASVLAARATKMLGNIGAMANCEDAFTNSMMFIFKKQIQERIKAIKSNLSKQS